MSLFSIMLAFGSLFCITWGTHFYSPSPHSDISKLLLSFLFRLSISNP